MFTSLFLTLLNREAASPKSRSEQIMEALQVREGWAVADLGSGGGYFTLRFAKKVGPHGKVYAIDKRADYLELSDDRRSAEVSGTSSMWLRQTIGPIYRKLPSTSFLCGTCSITFLGLSLIWRASEHI